MDNFEHITLTTPDLYDKALDDLIKPVVIKEAYPARHTFSMPGKDMDFIYYIKSGRTKHFMVNEDGSTKLLYTLTPGWFFGETPYFLKVPTGLYSQTETATVIYKIPNEVCKRLMAESELFRELIIKCFSHKLLMLRYEIANLTFNSVKNRLKRLFCSSVDTESISDPGWYNLKLRYTQSELGEIVGGSRVTVSRQINELCSEGFIRLINHRVQVNIKKYNEYFSSDNSEF